MDISGGWGGAGYAENSLKPWLKCSLFQFLSSSDPYMDVTVYGDISCLVEVLPALF